MPVVLGGRTVPDKTHDAALASGDVTAEQYEQWIVPVEMTRPSKA